MRAVQFREFGGPEVVDVVEVPDPGVRPGTVLIEVRAAGVNPADAKGVAGRYAKADAPSGPTGIGFEAAGRVLEVGEGVTGVEAGDEVFGFGRPTWAERAVLDVFALRPRHMPIDEAAATPVAADTAVRMLDAARVGAGDTVVISGAAGGVGTAAIQFARARGAIVIGTASAENQEYVEALGALPTTYDDGWEERVRDLAVAEVNAGLDVAGAGVLPQLIELTGDATRVVSVADASAPSLGATFTGGGGDRAAVLAEAVRLYEDGELRMIVERTVPFEDAREALAIVLSGHGRGKTVLELR